MARNFISSVILLIIVVYGFLFMPIYYAGNIDTARAQEELLYEVQLFLDKVADTKMITQADLEDFTLAMSSTSIPVEFEILREAKQVNPDPTSTTDPQVTYTTWVPHENCYNYENGDIIIIRVKQVGQNYYQAFSTKVLRMYIPEVEFQLARMVR